MLTSDDDAHLHRALDFLATPLVVEVLDHLRNGRDPAEAGEYDVLTVAVQKLRDVGAITDADDHRAVAGATLTHKGRRLAELTGELFAVQPSNAAGSPPDR